jgi:hypothetical protein
MAILKKSYDTVGGMNPLLFGAEGLDLTTRLLAAFPDGEIFYWPKMVIRHDYASNSNLLKKRIRQALSNEYFNVMHPEAIKIKNKYNSILRSCRKDQDITASHNLLRKIANHWKEFNLSLKSEKSLNIQQNTLKKQRLSTEIESNKVKKRLTEQDIRTLSLRIQTLEKEIEITRRSLSYKVGSIFGEAVSSPLREGPMLPFRLLRIAKNYLKKRRDESQDKKSSVPGSSMRNRLQYTRLGREEHTLNLFNEFQSFRNTCNSNLRIACILSSRMLTCFDLEAKMIPLDANNWKKNLEINKPDFLLVQSCLEKNDYWKEYISKLDGPSSQIIELVGYCNDRNIPTVFWDIEDHIHLQLFLKTAALFDHIFAADPQNVEAYHKLLNKRTTLLGPAVQPALHNPLRLLNSRYSGFTYLYDGWADLIEYSDSSDYLMPLFEDGLHIVESRYLMRANKLNDLPEYRKNILGCLSYKKLLSALRHYKVLILSDQSLSSPMQRSWKAIESMACGCDVLQCGERMLSMPCDIPMNLSDKQQLKYNALKMLENEIEFLRKIQTKRRKIYSSHTFAHRIATICKTIGIEHDWEQYPLVSVIVPTKRTGLLDACIKNFKSQHYPQKELIIIINNSNVDMDYVNSVVRDEPNIEVINIHQERNVGLCMNYGIAHAKGKYWFKMDDDDIYGENYLIDMVQLAECADFNIIGKPSAFIFMESDGNIYLRNGAAGNQHTIGSMHMPDLCGATLGGKKDAFSGFSERFRACVDTGFTEDSRISRKTIITGDIWNFIAHRHKDKFKHTWRLEDDDIKKNASFFENYCNRNTIML